MGDLPLSTLRYTARAGLALALLAWTSQSSFRASELAADADHNQISQQMQTIDRPAWLFQIVEILRNRNGSVVSHDLHELALRNQSLIERRKTGL